MIHSSVDSVLIEIDEQNGPAVAGPFCEEISLYISTRPLKKFVNGLFLKLKSIFFEPILQKFCLLH